MSADEYPAQPAAEETVAAYGEPVTEEQVATAAVTQLAQRDALPGGAYGTEGYAALKARVEASNAARYARMTGGAALSVPGGRIAL